MQVNIVQNLPFIIYTNNIAITGYSLFLIIAMLLSFIGFHKYLKTIINNYKFSDSLQLTFPAIIGGVIGSKILPFTIQLLSNPDSSLSSKFYNSGFSIIGAIIVSIPVIFLYKNYIFIEYKNIDSKKFMFSYIFAFLIGHPIAKIGCFLAGCCHGKITHSKYLHIIYSKQFFAPTNVPLIPVQLYESFAYLIIFILILFIYKKDYLKVQFVSLLSLFLTILVRFIFEFYRGESYTLYTIYNLNLYQWIQLIVLIFLIYLYIKYILWAFEKADTKKSKKMIISLMESTIKNHFIILLRDHPLHSLLKRSR